MALHIAEAGEHIAEAGEHIAKAGEAPSWTLPLPEMRVAHRVGDGAEGLAAAGVVEKDLVLRLVDEGREICPDRWFAEGLRSSSSSSRLGRAGCCLLVRWPFLSFLGMLRCSFSSLPSPPDLARRLRDGKRALSYAPRKVVEIRCDWTRIAVDFSWAVSSWRPQAVLPPTVPLRRLTAAVLE